MKFFLCLVALFFLVAAHAEEDADHDIIVLPRNEVVDGDYFASGKSIEISGVVKGDLYLFGAQIFVDGIVEGDVLIAGGSVNLSGAIHGDARILAGQLMCSGLIERNLTACCGNVETFTSSIVRGNIASVAGNFDLGGSVDGNVNIYASNLRVTDGIRGTLKAHVGQMRLTSNANIGGNLEYWSNDLAFIDDRARVNGEITHNASFAYHLFQSKLLKKIKIGSKLATLTMNFLYTFVLGLIFMRFFPHKVKRALDVLANKPLQALIAGLALVILLPLASLILLFTILGAPFALTLIAINVVAFYTVKILAILGMTRFLFKRFNFEKHRKLYFFCALLVYYGLTLIPYAGWVVSVTALLFGLGAATLGRIPAEQRKAT